VNELETKLVDETDSAEVVELLTELDTELADATALEVVDLTALETGLADATTDLEVTAGLEAVDFTGLETGLADATGGLEVTAALVGVDLGGTLGGALLLDDDLKRRLSKSSFVAESPYTQGMVALSALHVIYEGIAINLVASVIHSGKSMRREREIDGRKKKDSSNGRHLENINNERLEVEGVEGAAS
jgi:hypothetical protein